ncbi:dihydrofolate reductase [Marmoricola sp. OAE513]|uniref:dihydrofolate reductase family protein n=1 Tax=Marmoricola sp. OAE513 TaxID=2817894 RepID=UPI001AE43D45
MVTQYFTASSLDGFIAAEPEDGLAWLLSRDVDADGPQGYNAFIADVGALAMGATTYQWLLTHAPDEWYYEMPTWVFTHRTFPAVPEGRDIRFTADPVPEVHAQMAGAAGEKNVWIVGGGELAGQFHDHGLLDELWIQYAPLTLGAGAPLLPRRAEFEQIALDENREFACRRLRVKK